MVDMPLSRESSVSSGDHGFEVLNNATGSTCDDDWSLTSVHGPEHFFIGASDSPRGSNQVSDDDDGDMFLAVSKRSADMTASGTFSDADMAISMIMRDSDRQAVQQHVEFVRSESEDMTAKLALNQSELAARAEEVSKLKEEVAKQREESVESSQEMLQLSKETARHREDAKMALLEVAKLQDAKEQMHAAIKRAEKEAARADEAEAVMVAMNAEAASLQEDLATAAEANASLVQKLDATVAVDTNWCWEALQGVWMSEPGREIHWIDSASGGVWSKDGQWAIIAEYADGFALLPASESTCRGELLQSVRGSILLWAGKGAWVKQSQATVFDAWETGSRQLRCPASHVLRWAPTSSARNSKTSSSSGKSCKRWEKAMMSSLPLHAQREEVCRDMAMQSACSACNFPVVAESGMWQCRGCRYNVCGSCAAASAPVSHGAGDMHPFEVQPGQSFTCTGCSAACGSGKAVIGHREDDADHYLCFACFSVFLTQS